MELDILKSAWNELGNEVRPPEEIKLMIRENKHPVLKDVRKQLIIEIICWTIFLFVYYDFFDGDRRPLYLNFLLVASVLLLLVHNIMGYISTKNLVNGGNVKQSLENYLNKVKSYAKVSIASRALSLICLLLFFSSTITFDFHKYLALGGLLMVIPFQVIMLYRIWSKRITKLRDSIEEFT